MTSTYLSSKFLPSYIFLTYEMISRLTGSLVDHSFKNWIGPIGSTGISYSSNSILINTQITL